MKHDQDPTLIPSELFETAVAFGLEPVPAAGASRGLVEAPRACAACGADLGLTGGLIIARTLFCSCACAHALEVR